MYKQSSQFIKRFLFLFYPVMILMSFHQAYSAELPITVNVYNGETELTYKSVSFGLSSQYSKVMPPTAPGSEVDVMFFKEDTPLAGMTTNMQKDFRSPTSDLETWVLKVRLDPSIPVIDLGFNASSYMYLGSLTMTGTAITTAKDIAGDFTTNRLSLIEGDYQITFSRTRLILKAMNRTAGVGENGVRVDFDIITNNESLNTKEFNVNVNFDNTKLSLISSEALTVSPSLFFDITTVSESNGVVEVTLNDSTALEGIPDGYTGNVFSLTFNVLPDVDLGITYITFTPVTDGIKDSLDNAFTPTFEPGEINIINLFSATNDLTTVVEDSGFQTLVVLDNDIISDEVVNPNVASSAVIVALGEVEGSWTLGNSNGDIQSASSKEGGVIKYNNGVLSYKPKADFNGTDEFYYLGQIDLVGNNNPSDFYTSSAKVTINVTNINDAPVLASLPNLTVDEDTVIDKITLSASDVEGNPITFTAVTDNSYLVFTSIVGNELSIYLRVDASGSANITVTANDGQVQNSTDQKTFSLTVNAVNDEAPVLEDLAEITVDEDGTISVITLSATDFDGDAIIYDAISNNSDIATVSVDGDQLTVTLQPDANGTFEITVIASDGHGPDSFTEKTVTVTVNPVNDKPIIATLEDLVVNEDAIIPAITLSSNDVDDDNVTYSATSDNPSLLSVSVSGDKLTLSPQLNLFGLANITVSVTDGNGADSYSETTFGVTVNSVNDPPVLSALPDITVNEDEVVTTISLNATDPDGDDVLYAVESSDTNLVTATIDDNGLSLILVQDAHGSAAITITVSDGVDMYSFNEQTFFITVNPSNDPPSIEEIEITSSSLLFNGGTITVVVTATDLDGDELEYQYTWYREGKVLRTGNFSESTVSTLTVQQQNYVTDDFYDISCEVTVREKTTELLTISDSASTTVGSDKKNSLIALLTDLNVVGFTDENLKLYRTEFTRNQSYLDTYTDFYQDIVDAVNDGKVTLISEVSAGWNMISSPYSDWSPLTISGSENSRSMFSYNPDTFAYDDIDSSIELSVGSSYWIFINGDEIDESGKLVYIISGYPSSNRGILSLGWNMVGPLEVEEPWGNDTHIFLWNSEIHYYQDLDESGMKLGKGYWAFILSLPEETSE